MRLNPTSCVRCILSSAPSAQATEAVYSEEHWKQMSDLYREFTHHSRGVRMSGSAAANCCHLAMGEAWAVSDMRDV